MSYSEILIARIAGLCRQRRWSYNKLALMCGLKQSTIDNIMRGVTKDPRIQTLHHIALAFNMTVAELLDFQELNDYSFEDTEDGAD